MTTSHVILFVDDNLDAREMYCEYLRFGGFECLEAVDAQDALARARSVQPSVIIMDAMMPGMDGWQAIRELKADPVTQHIPVIMLTAHAFEEHRELSVAAGADLFIPKPVLPDQLAQEIQRLLSRGESGPKQ